VITYEWRGRVGNEALNALHAEGFGHRALADDDWWAQVNGHSLGWVCAWDGDNLGSFYFGACGFRPTNAGLIAL
jgi:hypothetical protein